MHYYIASTLRMETDASQKITISQKSTFKIQSYFSSMMACR